MGGTPRLGWVEIERVNTILNALIMSKVRNIIIIIGLMSVYFFFSVIH
jgi:hypothetical protein